MVKSPEKRNSERQKKGNIIDAAVKGYLKEKQTRKVRRKKKPHTQ